MPSNTSSKRGSIRARLAVARLWALSGPLALAISLAVRAVAKSDPELFPTATGLSALAPVTPLTPAICRFKDKRKRTTNTEEKVPQGAHHWDTYLTSTLQLSRPLILSGLRKTSRVSRSQLECLSPFVSSRPQLKRNSRWQSKCFTICRCGLDNYYFRNIGPFEWGI